MGRTVPRTSLECSAIESELMRRKLQQGTGFEEGLGGRLTFTIRNESLEVTWKNAQAIDAKMV